MSETDELKAHAAELRGMNASSDYRTFRKAADALDAAADRLEAQATALTASQETIDAQQARIAELEAFSNAVSRRLLAAKDAAEENNEDAADDILWGLLRDFSALAKHDTEKEIV